MYLGIGPHKRCAQVAVTDLEGEIAEGVRVKNTNLDDLAQRHAGSRAVIEVISNYYHVYNTLTEYLDVTVACPGKLTLIAQSDKKIDRIGVKELARLLRLNPVLQSYVFTDEIQEARVLVRGRRILAEDRIEFASKIRDLLADDGVTRTAELLSVEGREFLREFSPLSPWDSLLSSYLDVVEMLTRQMTQLEAATEERAGSLKGIQLLTTIPGVGYYSALLIYVELGEIDRLDGHEEVMSCMGLDPTVRGSGDSRAEGGISKRDSG